MTERAPDETEPDPRARWRTLPAEPTEWIEEKATSSTAADHGIPNIDQTEDFIRKYGLGG